MKLSFKRDDPTGRYRSFSDPTHNIKGDGKQVGWISRARENDRWRVWLHVKPAKEDSAPFNNRLLKGEWATAEEARAFVKANWAALEKLGLHQLED